MVFIGPPSFRPEQIANIGIALSARRSGVFDRRLPLNEEQNEMQFSSADAVSEFVRRSFISSSRGGGGDGGGGIPTEGGPDAPPPRDGDDRAEVQMTEAERFIEDWTEAVEGVKKRDHLHAEIRRERNTQPTLLPHVHDARQLGSVQCGALQVLVTVLCGVPWYGAKGPQFERWQEAAVTLDGALLELGLWGSWFTSSEPVRRRISDYLTYQLPKFIDEELRRKPNGITYALMVLRWQPTSSESEEAQRGFSEMLKHAVHFADDCRKQPAFSPSERYEALLTWPLPPYVRKHPKVRSVGELLATFVSAPQELANTRGALDIISFAAAFLASRTERRLVEGWRERAAANWLARSLPRYAFHRDIEAIIGNLP
jgi:hypothetical protein